MDRSLPGREAAASGGARQGRGAVAGGGQKAAKPILAKAKLGKDTRIEVTEARAQASDTFRKLAESYLAKAIEPRRRASYLRDVRRYLLVDAAPLHDLPVAAITRKRVAGLLDDMASRAPVAADRCRVALSTLFTWAMQQGLAERTRRLPWPASSSPSRASGRCRPTSCAGCGRPPRARATSTRPCGCSC